jgi:hypothetical protein
MDEEPLPSTEFYEDKAVALFRLALGASDDSAKRELLSLALEFERLAERARQRGRTATVH